MAVATLSKLPPLSAISCCNPSAGPPRVTEALTESGPEPGAGGGGIKVGGGREVLLRRVARCAGSEMKTTGAGRGYARFWHTPGQQPRAAGPRAGATIGRSSCGRRGPALDADRNARASFVGQTGYGFG